MFQAILHAKVRLQKQKDGMNQNWRGIFRETEDFLTAGIFGRLAYLPPGALWKLLKATVISKHEQELPEQVGNLRDIQFWPSWFLEDEQDNRRHRKEPDVFLRFEKLDLLVEAKRIGTQQEPQQWAEEQMAYAEEFPEEERPENCYLLAIGGANIADRVSVVELENKANRNITGGMNVRLLACSWERLYESLSTVSNNCNDVGINFRLIEDMIEILAFHGVRGWLDLSDLSSHKYGNIRADSGSVIRNWLQ